MNSCCGNQSLLCSDQFEYTFTNTTEGISIDVKPKDKSKVESLQKFAEAWKDFCGEGCC